MASLRGFAVVLLCVALQAALVPAFSFWSYRSDAVDVKSTVNLLSRWKRASTGGMKNVTLAVNFLSPLNSETERSTTTKMIKGYLNADIVRRWPSSSPAIDVLNIYKRKCRLSVKLTYSDHSECEAMKDYFNAPAILSSYVVEVKKNDGCPTAPAGGSASNVTATSCTAAGGVSGFRCTNGKCVEEVVICDGDDNCGDNSDEDHLMCMCRDHHLCDNGTRCVSKYDVCDGVPHCSDGSDEQGCGCPAGTRSCYGGKQGTACVDLTAICDGMQDCEEDQDEAHPLCGCRPDEFQCALTRECFPSSALCDGTPDCRDRTDEKDCASCAEGNFQCGNLCLPPAARCNGTADCPGGEDENNCSHCSPDQFFCDEACFPGEIRCNGQIECHDARDEIGCNVTCGRHEWRCANGLCISDHLRCNGLDNCWDASDEAGCPSECEPDEFRCSNGRCIRQIWRCDHDDDCGDKSDETNCGPANPGDVCRPCQFKCRDGRSCIPRSQHCNDRRECGDGSDELGCAPPSITKPPPVQKTTPLHSTFDITCQATGVPPPIFVWRFNNRHLPRNCITRNRRGSSTLRCRRVTRSHQGTYSCEAHNNQGRAVARPSTVLTVGRSLI